MRSSPIPWSADVSSGEWASGMLGSARTSIDWMVPLVYEAYVRLERPDLADGATQVARRVVDLLRRLERGALSDPAEPDSGSSSGLAQRTQVCGSLNTCWFAVADLSGWNGHDPDEPTPFVRLSDRDATALRADPVAFFESRTSFADPTSPAAPRAEPYPYPLLKTGRRSYMLFPGPLEHGLTSLPAAGAPTQIPDLWWPADRAWFLGSDTDFTHLFLGGSRNLIDHVLSDSGLHATEIEPDPAPD